MRAHFENNKPYIAFSSVVRVGWNPDTAPNGNTSDSVDIPISLERDTIVSRALLSILFCAKDVLDAIPVHRVAPEIEQRFRLLYSPKQVSDDEARTKTRDALKVSNIVHLRSCLTLISLTVIPVGLLPS